MNNFDKQAFGPVFFLCLFVDVSEKYKIRKELGSQKRRKFGRVFLAENKIDGERCVIKALQINPETEHLTELFQRESEFSFNFTGLPEVLDYWKNDHEIFLVLKYKEGVTIDEYWKTVPKNERIAKLKEFISALVPLFTILSEQHIVHGDIKLSNLLVHSTDQGITVHLLDFGLAIRKKNIDANRKILFPLGFASPEQVLNKLELIDHTSDIFSLGIVIWKLFTGKLPLVHPNPSIFTNLQITHPLPEHDAIPKDLFKILSKMCYKHTFATSPNRMNEKEVSKYLKQASMMRYQSLQEVLVDLNRLSDKRSWISRVLS